MKRSINRILSVCLVLSLISVSPLAAQNMLVYHVVGKVVQYHQGKSTPLVMKSRINENTEINIPYGGKVELIDEKESKRITLTKAGHGTIKKMIASNDNSITKISNSYLAYVKKQMNNSGLTSKQRYTDFATVTRELDSVKAEKKKKPASFREQFDDFSNQSRKKYDSFRAECNKKYTDFVRQAWEKMGQSEPVSAPKDQEVRPEVKPVQHDTDRFYLLKRRRVKLQGEIKLAKAIESPKPQPQPVEPIVEVEQTPEEEIYSDMPFQFYGTELHIRLDESKRINLGKISPDRVADVLQHFSTKTYDNLLFDCLKIRKERKLCDWAYLLMLKELTDQFCGPGTNEAALLLGYLYYQSGYKVRFGHDDNRIYVLVASDHVIYGRGPYVIEDQFFYPIENVTGFLYICKAPFPKERTLSLYIPEQPVLDHNDDEGRTITSKFYPEISVKVKINKNLLDFYENYPSSQIDDNFLTRWAMYANTPMDSSVQAQIYPVLREKLKGLSELEAANRLLDLVQNGFKYEYDDKVWGGDRAFFAEESLHYPFCDCEDRSILYTRLVRDLLGLDCALVYYPGHLATAVKFTELPDGTYYTTKNDGVNYTICDPTYINAPVGEPMKQYKDTAPQLIRLKK